MSPGPGAQPSREAQKSQALQPLRFLQASWHSSAVLVPVPDSELKKKRGVRGGGVREVRG